jgi:hypothetical protein
MRIRILRDRRFVPPNQRRIAVAFKAGTEVTTKREWGEALIESGDAEEIEPPKKA